MFRSVTVRELSLGKAVCQFCHFLIYNSVRFIYIPVTFSFFFFCWLKLTPCHFHLAIRAICGKSLFLNGLFLPKRLPNPATAAIKMPSHCV